jgi:hypothetical protein
MNSSRRSFLKTGLLALASLPILGRLTPLAHADDAALPFADPKQDPAKTLKFCENAEKPAKCEIRKDKAKKDQFCMNCQLFQRLSGDGKKGDGKCLVMVGKKGHANAWCNSWVQNPAIKS